MIKYPFFAVFLLLACASVSFSAPITYTETYLGGPAYQDIWSGQSRVFNFDLTGKSAGATNDAKGFVPGIPISSAILKMDFSSMDLMPEKILLKASQKDGGATLFEETLFLGKLFGKCEKWETGSASIDLLSLGLANHLSDGKFAVAVSAPDKWLGLNDFRLDQLSLSVGTGATAPVPEPGTIALLATGLGGLLFFRRGLIGRKKGAMEA